MSKLIQFYILNKCSLLYAQSTSLKIFKKKQNHKPMQRFPLPHTPISQTTLLQHGSFSLSGHPYVTFIFKCLNLNKIIDDGKEHTQIRCRSFCPLEKEL